MRREGREEREEEEEEGEEGREERRRGERGGWEKYCRRVVVFKEEEGIRYVERYSGIGDG
ncbi:hypothetical protein BUY41_03955 [Staphylococcus cohnii]|nr:hypothetical protein BUY41_03955 [Staphylococcus cohnii]